VSAIAFQIMLALADQDRHGVAIMQEVLVRTRGTMRLWPAMLYRNLRNLQRDGLIAEVAGDAARGAAAAASTGAGRPRFFRLTSAGRRACAAEARRLATFVDAARDKRLLGRR
jgi:DNA-binding PadR family transcriptional regulator